MAAFDMRNPDQPARIALRRLAFPAMETLAITALHVGFLARARARRCPAFAEATAGKPARAGSVDWNRPSEASFEGLSGQLGMPSEIVRQPRPHGSSLPGGAGLANLPGAVANRIGDTTASLAIQGSPHEAPLVSEADAIRS